MNTQLIGFTDIRQDGRLPVRGADGEPIAFIYRTSRWNRRFRATGADGVLLCTGRSPTFGWKYRAFDSAGGPLLSVSSMVWAARSSVVLPGKAGCSIQGHPFTRDWQLQDGVGAALLSVRADAADLPFGDGDWVLTNHGDLPLAQVIGVVELTRMRIKSARAAARSRRR